MELFEKFIKEDYTYKVTKGTIDKDNFQLTLEIRLNFVVPFQELEKIKKGLMAEIPEIKQVQILFSFENMVSSKEETVKNYIPYILHQMENQYAGIMRTVGEMKWEDETLVFYALGDSIVEQLNHQVAPGIQRALQENFDYNFLVEFRNDKQSCEKATKKVAEEIHYQASTYSADKPKKSVSAKPNEGMKQRRGQKVFSQGKQILGKAIKGEVSSMAMVKTPGESIVIEGEVFRIESKRIKNGKQIVTLYVADNTTSACGKFFIDDERWEVVGGRLYKNLEKKSMREHFVVKIEGEVEWDKYSDTNVVMIKSLEEGKSHVVEDHAKEKRVELHAHTKMSAMDGLNDPKDLVSQAIKWGHKAIAITDHGVVQSFPTVASVAQDKIKVLYGMEGYVFDDRDCIDEEGNIDYKKKKTNHIILLAKNQKGLKNLYQLVSTSHIDYFYRKPRIPKSILTKHREGLIVGSACEAGEVFRGVTGKVDEGELKRLVEYYDYLEIQPLANNKFMINKGIAQDEEELKAFNLEILRLGREYNKPVVATCDAHYGTPEEALYRNILMAGLGYTDPGSQGLYFRNTEDMLAEFDYLDEDVAREVVIENPNKIADSIDWLSPVPKGKFPPVIPDSEKILRDICEKNMTERYGDNPPDVVVDRINRELESIIGNGYAVMYVAAKMLVDKSLEDGFLVGSRGSVGSSFAATMSGITEVNPLPPHYICPKCKRVEFGDESEYDCGVDMPEKLCDTCNITMEQEGFSIPFETFLGFEGDKEPDIDLNFAGEYQGTAHKFVDEIFGAENVYKAGTIGKLASKTAYGFVRKYFETKEQNVNRYEIDRLTMKCEGVRRTTGQHPGGIIIVPRDHDIHEFCPVQRPANDMKTDIVTTHFDYHAIDQNLLKLDILGHFVPSMIRKLQDMTGVDPQTIPLKDKKVTGIFNGVEGLNIIEKDYQYSHGSYGIPEFGTKFVRQMLDDTKPDKFADLVRISGFSHGTDVWLNNAQTFIRSGEATMREAISTRDDIMNYLILKGLPPKTSFDIMEKVRKGKGITPEQEELMIEKDVAPWYIESCKKIKYMFPRAHAVAYVMMSYRIAYYKVYYPEAFYAVYLSTKIADFSWGTIKKGREAILNRIKEIENKDSNAKKKDEDEVIVLEIAYEMMSRGISFMDPTLEDSKALDFTVKGNKVVVPLCALTGVGETVGKAIEKEQRVNAFGTIEELQTRAKANKVAVESLRDHGVLEGMPESDQISLF